MNVQQVYRKVIERLDLADKKSKILWRLYLVGSPLSTPQLKRQR